jgi:hypothetical protein
LPTVTGTLTEIAGGHLAGKFPELVFALNKPGITGSTVYPTEQATITPASDGTFTVSLADTTKMLDDSYYTLSIQWFDRSGNFNRIDYPEWQIRVPSSGGPIGDLRGNASNLSMVYVSTTPPDKPVPFMLWLEQDPANPDPYDPANTGKLYRWEKV